MGKLRDLTGQRFGRLVVIKRVANPPGSKKEGRWLCQCDCGRCREITLSNLTAGHTKSCGCLTRERAIETNTTHGLSKTRFYQIWRDMLDRTTRRKNFAYTRYGERGIRVCDRWTIFENYMEDMYSSYLVHCSEYGEQQTTIERIANGKGYSPDNCRWATPHEQNLNRRSNKRYQINGELLTVYEMAQKYNLTYSCALHRVHRGWPPERIIEPMRRRQG